MTTILPPFRDEGVFLNQVEKIDIYEHNPNFDLLAHETFFGPFRDQATIDYESVAGTGSSNPNSLQVVLTALTDEGSSVLNMWTVTFSEPCIIPVLTSSSTIGWARVVSPGIFPDTNKTEVKAHFLYFSLTGALLQACGTGKLWWRGKG